METGRDKNKLLTAVTQSGVTPTGASSQVGATIKRHQVDTPNNINYHGEDDSHKTLTGPSDGAYASSSGQHVQKWGYTAPSGSQIQVDDSPGGERINIVHHSGAGVVVDPDGSVFVSSTSRRGAGIAAPYGDYYISAGGDVVIKGGASVSIDTAGDLTISVGGTLNIKCGAYNLITKVSEETIDGSASRSVTNDQSTIIGGINRLSVAGDMREQISGSLINDVAGNTTSRTDGDVSNDVGGKSTTSIGKDQATSVQGTNVISSQGDGTVSSKSKMNLSSDSDLKLSGQSAVLTSSSGTVVSSQGSTSVSGVSTKISGTGVRVDGSSVSIRGGSLDLNAPAVNINTGTLNSPIPTGSSGGASSPTVDPTNAPQSAGAVIGPEEAQTMEAKDIVDSLTSTRKYPKYPGNGVLESAAATSVSMVSHDSTPGAEGVYNEYSGGNQGNLNPSSVGGSYTTLPDTPINRDPNISVEQPGISVPSRYSNSSKISRYFSLGDIVNAKHSHPIPPDKWNEIVQQHINVAFNVLDPIKQHFPDIIITSGYRENSSNHITGKAIDLVVSSRSLTKHAEIARYVRDNLPVDQVFLERNDSGRTHVHVRVGSGTPLVKTCGDKLCHSSTSGIDVEWLQRGGKR